MKRMLLISAIIFLFVMNLPALTDKERIDLTLLPIETTHVLFVLKVPVITDGTTRPDIPEKLRELRSSDLVIYDDEAVPSKSSWCLVFMLVPKENEAEFISRNNTYPVSVTELITLAKEGAAEVAFPDFQDTKTRLLERITNADSYKSLMQ